MGKLSGWMILSLLKAEIFSGWQQKGSLEDVKYEKGWVLNCWMWRRRDHVRSNDSLEEPSPDPTWQPAGKWDFKPTASGIWIQPTAWMLRSEFFPRASTCPHCFGPCNTLSRDLTESTWMSDSRNCEWVDECSFKLLNVWQFVTQQYKTNREGNSRDICLSQGTCLSKIVSAIFCPYSCDK